MILAAVNACLDEAAKRYPTIPRLFPEVRMDLRGQATAQAGYRRGDYFLRFNLEAYALDADYLIGNTVPHEVAHLVAHALSKRMAHCALWRSVCLALGGNGKRCHNLRTTPARLFRQPLASAPRVPVPRPLRVPAAKRPRLSSVPRLPAPAPAPGVVTVEAIETPAGGLYLVAFDASYDITALYAGIEGADRFPPMLDALVALGTDAAAGWPDPEPAPQAVYDALTRYPTGYRVIGRWWRGRGLDLRELDMAGAAGRAWSGGMHAAARAA